MDGPPTRYRDGGTRGGLDQFKWDSVKGDKYKDNYLGKSLFVEDGSWIWNKGGSAKGRTMPSGSDADRKREEMRAVKQREAELLQEAMGLKPKSVTRHKRELEAHEMQELLKRGETNREEDAPAERAEGFGYVPAKQHDVQDMLPGSRYSGAGVGDDDLRKGTVDPSTARSGPRGATDDDIAKGVINKRLAEKMEKKMKKEAKKEKKRLKKEKKEKKREKKARKRSRSVSSSSQSGSSAERGSPARYAVEMERSRGPARDERRAGGIDRRRSRSRSPRRGRMDSPRRGERSPGRYHRSRRSVSRSPPGRDRSRSPRRDRDWARDKGYGNRSRDRSPPRWGDRDRRRSRSPPTRGGRRDSVSPPRRDRRRSPSLRRGRGRHDSASPRRRHDSPSPSRSPPPRRQRHDSD